MPSFKLQIGDQEIEIFLRPSLRVRRLRLEAKPGVGIVAVAPPGTPLSAIERLVRHNAAWVHRQFHWLERHAGVEHLTRDPAEYRRHAPEALHLAHELVAQINTHYGFKVGRIQIRNQVTRWGSCSRHGAISFNWKIALVPRELAEYVVAHELCHIGKFDHSPKFWALVAETIPDWRIRRRNLHKFHL
jgi:hypothetical protein